MLAAHRQSMLIVLGLIALWSGTGLLMAWGFRRHGHNFWILAGLGLAYGPLVAAFVLNAPAPQQPIAKLVADDHLPANPDGWLDVLVGHDGTPDSTPSVLNAVTMLGGAIRRLRYAGVLDYEMGASPDRFAETESIESEIRRAADQTQMPHVEVVLLQGQPDAALVDHALDEGFHLLVVAHRQHRVESSMLGSTVARLAKSAGMPLLIGPPSTPSTNAPTDQADAKGTH